MRPNQAPGFVRHSGRLAVAAAVSALVFISACADGPAASFDELAQPSSRRSTAASSFRGFRAKSK